MKIQPVIVTLLIWFGGMAVSFIRLLFRYFRVAKKVRAGAMCKDVRCEKFLKMEIDTTCMKAEKTGNKRKSKIQILNSESIDTPLSFGLFHKMILLPQKGYSYSELYHILSHEYTHFINKDLNRKLFLQILCCIFWWLPPIYALRKIMEQAMEIKCDADVTEDMSDSEKADYLKTIVAMLRYGNEDILERFRLVSDEGVKGKSLFAICVLLMKRRLSGVKSGMKKSVQASITLMTLLRSPLKTMLTFMLIAAASFALLSKVTDCAVMTREMRKAESFYHGVATLEEKYNEKISATDVASPDGSAHKVYVTCYTETTSHLLKEEQEEAYSNMPGVTLLDRKYKTAGMVENAERMNGYDEYARFPVVFEGTYAGYQDEKDDASILSGHVRLAFDDVKVIACEKELDLGDHFVLQDTPLGDNEYAASIFTRDYFDKLKEGDRFLILGTYTGYQYNDVRLDFEKGADALRIIEDAPDNYLETEAFARQKGWVEAIRYNTYVFDMDYAKDMRAIPCFNDQSMYLKAGRMLNAKDMYSCVVSEAFLSRYGLSVGDSIRVGLGDRIVYGTARVDDREDMSGFGDETELEIVGAFEIEPTAHVDYSENSIFVPASLKPYESLSEKTDITEVNFFAEQAEDIEDFHNAMVSLAEKMDMTLNYSDRGWLDVKDNLKMGRFTMAISSLLYILGASLALLLAVYLYVGRNQKDFAIMRTLGVPAWEAEHSVLLPFVGLSVVSIPIGGIAGILYAKGAVEAALSGMLESAPIDYVPNTSLSVATILMCLLAELTFISLITYRFLLHMRNTPPLELLQQTIQWAGDEKEDEKEHAALVGSFDISGIPTNPAHEEERTYSAFRHVMSYVLRHMGRSKGKTVISVILTVVLAGGIGMFVLARLMCHDAFYDMQVKGKMDQFAFSTVSELSKSPYVKDFYCKKSFFAYVKGKDLLAPMVITNDFAKVLGKDALVEYGEGYSVSDFEKMSQFCLIGEGLAKKLGISSGDEIEIMSEDMYSMLLGSGSEEEQKRVENAYKAYQVIGIVKTEDESIYTGLRQNVDWLFGMMDFAMDSCEFVMSDNDKVEEIAAFLEEELQRKNIYMPMGAFHIDRGGLSHIKRIQELLEVLFPIAVVGAVLIGLFGPLLVILQSAKEAAFMRVLGTTKRRVRCILILEQILLCVAGLVLVTGGFAVYNGELLLRGIGTIGICYGLYWLSFLCGASAAAVHVTRYRVLRLLQVKEYFHDFSGISFIPHDDGFGKCLLSHGAFRYRAEGCKTEG